MELTLRICGVINKRLQLHSRIRTEITNLYRAQIRAESGLFIMLIFNINKKKHFYSAPNLMVYF